MGDGRIFKVIVIEGDQEEPKVEVTVPIKLAKWALKVLPAVEGEVKKHADIDINALSSLLDEGFDEMEKLRQFDLVKIKDKNTIIRISVEGE